MFLAVMDAHSKWFEVVQMSSIISFKTVTELHKLFSAYDLPDQPVSDKGPQFTSDKFTKANGTS